jgi:hypothetical protein
MMTEILTDLTATKREGDAPDTQDIMRQVHGGKSAGQFRTLSLSAQGLAFRRAGKITAFIPHDELWKLEGGPGTDAARKDGR